MDEEHDEEAEIEPAGAGHGDPDENSVLKMNRHAAFYKPGEGKADRIEKDVGDDQKRFYGFRPRDVGVDE